MYKIINSLLGIMLLFFVLSCGEEIKEMPKAEVQTGEGIDKVMPSGHPTVKSNALDEVAKGGHPTMASDKEVKVSDQTKETWPEVKIEITDSKTSKTTTHTVKLGATLKLGDDFSLEVKTFLPDYSIFDEYIGSRSEELNNPALLMKLTEGSEVKTSGWIFKKFTDFDSFKSDRFRVVLLTPEG